MIWFEGSISNAVQSSKSKNAIFVVYVEGKDENSNKMSEMINHPDASTKLESSNFVAVKLEAGSESYNQFVQIYQLVPVPSLFFIGKNGAPIEVIPQHLENDEFLSKIDKIIETSGVNPIVPSAGMAANSTSLINAEIKASTSYEASGSTSKQADYESKTKQDDAVKVETTDIPSVSSITAESLSPSEKIERAKQLIDEQQKTKRLEEEETQRKKELERRKMGQEIQKMRRQQQDQEMKHIREEILRERNEELAARQKILAQIEQDKEERAKKFSQATATTEPSTSAPATPIEPNRTIPRNSRTALLQFRFADGTSHTKDFVPTSTLHEIREYVQANLNLPYRQFDLSTTFPRRQFSAEDNNRTLIDLELIPNAVMLVVPVTGVAVTPARPSNGLIATFIWFFFWPVFTICDFVVDKFNNWRNPRPVPFKRPSDDAGPSGASGSSNGPSLAKRRIPPDSTVIRRHGNVHRLSGRKDDSDDDNNTWNGNSTQQM